MITVDSLTRTYGAFTAVDDITFTAEPGRVTGFLGPNGAGKSTTMRIMVGLTPATSGTATINGQRFADLPNPGLEVGVLLDASAQHAGRTGREILTVAQRMMGLPARRVDEMLDLVSLTDDEAGRRVRQLLARHAPAARHRHGAARRPGRAHPRRAGQRPRPGRASAGCATCCAATPTAAAPCCSPRTCCTRSRSSPTTWSSSVRAGSSPRAPRPSCCARPAPWSAPTTRRARRAPSTPPASSIVPSTAAGGTDALRVDADPGLVGKVAQQAGVALAELRAAEGAGPRGDVPRAHRRHPTRRSSSMTTLATRARRARGAPTRPHRRRRRSATVPADPAVADRRRRAAQVVRHPLGLLAAGQHRHHRRARHRRGAALGARQRARPTTRSRPPSASRWR